MDTFELQSISRHNQAIAELSRRGVEIAAFYRTMVDNGMPERLAGRVVLEWTRALIDDAIDSTYADGDGER